MTPIQMLSFLVGMILASMLFTMAIMGASGYGSKYTKQLLIVFLGWIGMHISLSIDRDTTETVSYVFKSDVKYYLNQYKSSDLQIDKEMYDKFKALGNDVYEDQDFYIKTNAGRYTIDKSDYEYVVEYKPETVSVGVDTWGNKTLNLYE